MLIKPNAMSCLCGVILSYSLVGCGGSSDSNCDFDSTFEAIQSQIFDAKGCTSAACHGKADDPAGGLDLREGFALESLVRIRGQAGPMDLVVPGDQDRSLLYLKLAAKTLGTDLPDGIVGDPMPFGDGLPALSEDELAVLETWIRAGAQAEVVVKGTEDALGCDGVVEADPNKMEPLDPPAANEGLQFYSGAWTLAPESEDEVCFASYYDFSQQIPDSVKIPCPTAWGPGRECFTYGTNELAQDGQSHHSIIQVYTGNSDPNSTKWGPWTCLGGARNGESCDPPATGGCGARSECTTPAVTSLACLGYRFAPTDFGAVGFGAPDDCEGADCDTAPIQVTLSGAQESTWVNLMSPGVYAVVPVKGFISWNSHAFNLTNKETTIEQWVNVEYVAESERRFERQTLFEADRIFAMNPVAPFQKREVCMTFTLPRYARLMTLSSHMHERGELFEIWGPPHEPCVGGSFLSADRNCQRPNDEPMYVSRFYNDPVYTYFTPPMDPFTSEDANDRTFKACAVFDNGADNPIEVKRNSNSLNIATCNEPFANCGCEAALRSCFLGVNQGMPCDGDDSVCGEGGTCDACPLLGGITTDSEMFIPFGFYFIEAP